MQCSVNSLLANDGFCNFDDNLCKQFEPRSGPIWIQTVRHSNVLKKLIVKNQQATKTCKITHHVSLHCLFVLFSEPVSQPQIPLLYSVYLYCFQNQSPSLRFPYFTLSICIVFRTSLPASDPSAYTVYLYCFQNQSPRLRFPQFTLSICIVFRKISRQQKHSKLHCLFVLFSEPVY